MARNVAMEYVAIGVHLARDCGRGCGVDPAAACHIVERVDEPSGGRDEVHALKAPLERSLLLNAALAALERLPQLPLPLTIVDLVCDAFCRFASYPDSERFAHADPRSSA